MPVRYPNEDGWQGGDWIDELGEDVQDGATVQIYQHTAAFKASAHICNQSEDLYSHPASRRPIASLT